MAKGTRYTATHDGQTFTRTSARTYTHAVVTRVTLADAIAAAERTARYDWKANLDYHREWATGTSEFAGLRPWHTTEEAKARKLAEDATQVEQSKALLAGGEEALVEAAKANAERRWRQTWGDQDAGWVCRGWCGRPDLAAKLAEPGDIILEAIAG